MHKVRIEEVLFCQHIEKGSTYVQFLKRQADELFGYVVISKAETKQQLPYIASRFIHTYLINSTFL